MKAQVSIGKVLQYAQESLFMIETQYIHAESRFVDHFWIPISQTTEASDFSGI